MMSILYNLFIMPIEMIVEVVYFVMSRLLNNKGVAIITVSLVVQTLILPLYKRADAIQEEELLKRKSLEKWERHIKKTFKKDEQFMMLQTYYNQQDYKIWFSMRSSISILLQIPFFIAAYHYLSNLSELNGVQFGIINDLSLPDGILSLGDGIKINVLPVMMTVFNLISCQVYSKGQSIKTRIQGWSLAAIFLILLYNSPSGLVLYWTCNNLYSLIKNIVLKVVCVSNGENDEKKNTKGVIYSLLSGSKPNIRLIFAEELFMTILIGGVIPMATIGTSASEFIIGDSNPLMLIVNTISICAGFFIIWTSVFYYLMREDIKTLFQNVFAGIAVVSLVNYLIFANKIGNMSALFVYDNGLNFSLGQNLANIIIILIVCSAVSVITAKHSDISNRVLVLVILGMVVICLTNYSAIRKNLNHYYENYQKKAGEGIIKFSKKGKNVIVLMLDKANSGYFPFILDERPDLKKELSGFVYYPNTISFGGLTKLGAPSIFGGYEYTPIEINKRVDERLVDKHDEALKVMPVLFLNNGFNVTVCDPPYAGYCVDADYSIYDDIEGLKTFATFNAYGDEESNKIDQDKQLNNSIYYALNKVMPTIIQERFYNKGNYCNTRSKSFGFSSLFSDWYTALDNFDTMAEICDDDSDNCFIIQNCVTHDPTVLKKPDYVPDDSIDIETEIQKQTLRNVNGVTMLNNNENRLAYYDANMSAMLMLNKWADYLKENEVYDNTRIIVVADHGAGRACAEMDEQLSILHYKGQNVMMYNPLLLVKDFNASGEIKTDDTFMTNADTLTIATSEIIENPKNPFTGNLINSDEKLAHNQYIATTIKGADTDMSLTTFGNEDADWFIVHNNIFDENNWELGKCRE